MLPRTINDESDDEAGDRQTASLGGLAITLLLLAVSLFLVRELQATAPIEWGMLVNCDPDLATPIAVTSSRSWSADPTNPVGFRRIGMSQPGSGALDYWESRPETG
jgi:hypothetical protein